MNDWNIQSRGHQCHICQKPFEDKTGYHTVLGYENKEYIRHDICEPCWINASEGATDRKGYISHWQGTYEAPPPAPPEAIQKDNAESLLRKLLKTDDSRWREASYILAVMLERKRVLKVKDQLKDKGERIFIYEISKTGDIFTIPDPNLKMEQLEQVQTEVAALLEYGLPEKGVPWPPKRTEPEGENSENTEEYNTPPSNEGKDEMETAVPQSVN